MNHRAFLTVLFCALITMPAPAPGGELAPPVGPVAPTMKDLKTIEPRTPISAANTPGDATSLFKITAPGSYYLTGNVTGVANKYGIRIASSNVTIDLMGFTLEGVANSLDGIGDNNTTYSNLTVRNGVVSKWGSDGIHLVCRYTLVEGVHASENSWDGIFAIDGLIRGCAATSNMSDGITGEVIENCVTHMNTSAGIEVIGGYVRGCNSTFNTGPGFRITDGCTVTDCSANQNGTDGIKTDSACTVTNCTAYSNTGDGIQVGSACLVQGNTCRSNGVGAGDGAGIRVEDDRSRIEGNVVAYNDRGIDVRASGNFIVRNTAGINTTNYVIVANNYVGEIFQAPVSGAISGSTGGAGVGTATNPWANFSY